MRTWRQRVGSARGAVHRVLFTASRGRLLKRWGRRPSLELTTVGRRSGRRTRTMLVAVVREPHRIVVAASNGGADTHPHWFLNLSADPHVEVLIDGRRRPMIASVADAAARARLWPQVVRDSPAYQRYQERTSREIPLVILTER